MKKIFALLMILLPLGTFAQNLEGFWGLQFATNTEKVQDLIKARTGKTPLEGSGDNVIAYRNCDFGGNKAYLVQLMFFNNKLYGGDIIITPSAGELMTVYNSIVAEIGEKYRRNVKGDEQVTAVYTPGNASWNFAGSMAEISATIQNNVIKISYRDGRISGQMTAALEGYRRNDY